MRRATNAQQETNEWKHTVRCHAPSLLQGANRLNDLVLFGESAGRMLGIYRFAVGDDIENAAAALDQLDLGAELFLEYCLQPGGTRKVASTDAVCNGDFHGDSLCDEELTRNGRPVPEPCGTTG